MPVNEALYPLKKRRKHLWHIYLCCVSIQIPYIVFLPLNFNLRIWIQNLSTVDRADKVFPIAVFVCPGLQERYGGSRTAHSPERIGYPLEVDMHGAELIELNINTAGWTYGYILPADVEG